MTAENADFHYFTPPAYLDGPLFDVQGDWLEVADLTFGSDYHYIEGYRKAALLVAENATKCPGTADQFVYPAVFMFRHAIELLLKQLLELFGDAPADHEIEKLWTALRPLLVSEGLPLVELDTVEERLMELHEMDKRATGFRYAYLPTKGNDPLVRRSVSGGLNVKVFAERADSLCNVLDGWEMGITEKRDWRHEMQLEWQEYNEP